MGNRAVASLVAARTPASDPAGASSEPVTTSEGPAPGGGVALSAQRLPVQRFSVKKTFKRLTGWVKGLFGGKGKPKDEDSGTGETAPTTDVGTSGTTESAEVELSDSTVAPEMERGTKPVHPPTSRPGFDLAGGQQILTKAFGNVKTIVPGKIEVLDQAGFQAAYDKIYGSGPYSWDKYVKPKYGSLNGFAHDGVNYINKASAGLHTIVHEMLHNNTASDWRGVVGSRWDEGTTEVLTQVACKLFNEPAPICYPGESPVVRVALDNGLPIADLEDAYLVGGAQKKVADWVDAHCVLTWAGVKQKMEAQDWAAAKAGLAPKSTTPAHQPSQTSVGGTSSPETVGVGGGTK